MQREAYVDWRWHKSQCMQPSCHYKRPNCSAACSPSALHSVQGNLGCAQVDMLNLCVLPGTRQDFSAPCG